MSKKMRYNDKELGLIKSSFAENEDLMIVLRKALSGFKLDAKEQKHVDAIFGNKEVADVLQKTLAPVIDPDCPMFMQADLWIGMQMEFGNPEAVEATMKVRAILVGFMQDKFAELRGEKVKAGCINDLTITTEDVLADPMAAAIALKARNDVISHIDFQLNQLLILAGQKAETVEATQKRLAKDSSR